MRWVALPYVLLPGKLSRWSGLWVRHNRYCLPRSAEVFSARLRAQIVAPILVYDCSSPVFRIGVLLPR